MSGPWEDYGAPTDTSGPWADYAPAPRSIAEQAGRLAGQFGQNFNDSLYDAVMAIPEASGWIARQIGLVPANTPPPSERLRQSGRTTREGLGIDYTPRFGPEDRAERIAGEIGQAAGTVASTVIPAAGVAGAAVPATVQGARIVAPTVGRGIAETLAANPGMQVAANSAGNIVTGETDNPWLGMAATLAVPVTVQGGVRVFRSAPATSGAEAERRALLADAQKEGIPISFGNIIDSWPAKMAEDLLSKLPFVSNRQVALTEEGKTAFNRAAFEKVPATAGQGLDAATPGTLESVRKRVGDQFNNLSDNTTIRLTPQYGADLDAIEKDFGRQLTSTIHKGTWDKLQELKTAATALRDSGVTGVEIDGRTYQNIRSNLTKDLVGADGKTKRAVGQIIEALDDAAERSMPKDQMQDWRDARTSWRRLSMIDDAVSARHNGQSAVGHIPPGSLEAKAGNDKDMSRLAQIGVKYVGDKMPDNGTAMRAFYLDASGLGAGAWAPWLASR